MQTPYLPLAAGAFGACLLTLLNRFIGAWLPLPSPGSLASHGLSLLYLAALLLALMVTARAAARLPLSSAFLLTTAAVLAVPMGMALLLPRLGMQPPLWIGLTANNLFLPVAAALAGAAIGRVIRHPNTLLAAAGFAIFFDLVVVTMGTVAALQSSGSNLISMVSVGAGASLPPHPFAKSYPIVSAVTIGPADILFLALFQSSVALLPTLQAHWNLSLGRTFAWMYALLLLALALVETTALPVPALVPMGAAVLIANLRHAAFTPQEKRDLLIGGAFALLCAAGIIYGARRLQPPPPDYGMVMTRIPQTREILVAGLQPGLSAQKGGLRLGDVIEKLGETATGKASDEQIMEQLRAGARRGLEVRIRRPRHERPIDLTLPPP